MRAHGRLLLTHAELTHLYSAAELNISFPGFDEGADVELTPRQYASVWLALAGAGVHIDADEYTQVIL